MMNTSMNVSDVQVLDTLTPNIVCVVEVPLDEAVVPEVVDQLLYLYGFDCYASWRWAAATSFPLLLT